jgi:conjugative transposon TraM protein
MLNLKKTNVPLDEPTVPGQETAKKQAIGRKKSLYLIAGVVFVLLLTVFGLIGGYISTNPEPTDTVANSYDLTPPDANPKRMDARNKYDLGYSLSPNATSSDALDRQAAESTQKLTGHGPGLKMTNNEGLTERDYREVQRANVPTRYQTPAEAKQQQQRQFEQGNRRAVSDQNRVLRTLYQSPKSPEQRAEWQADREERDYNRRTTDAVLKQMELANSRALGVTPATNVHASASTAEPLHMTEYKQLKQRFGGQLPATYLAYFKREAEADQNGTLDAVAAKSDENTTRILHTARSITTATHGFYGLNGRRSNSDVRFSAANLAIPAVVHGDGGPITLTDGSTVKIRLTEDTQLLLNGDRVSLPAHTLVSGICRINGERIQITVSNLRVGNALLSTNLTAYDLDGRLGLLVPNLQTKNRVAQTVAQSSQTAMNAPQYLISQGGFGQQVGAQMAVQAGSSIINGLRSLATSKLSATKVQVKPNYQLYLKAIQQANQPALNIPTDLNDSFK